MKKIMIVYSGASPTTHQTSPVVTFGLEKECLEQNLSSLFDAIRKVENTENYKIYVSKTWIENGKFIKNRDFCIDGKKLKKVFDARWFAFNAGLGDDYE